MQKRTPIEIIQLYWNQFYNERDYEIVRELCADPIVRHDPGGTTPLDMEEQIARVIRSCTSMEPYFTHEVLFEDQDYVCSVWNMYTRTGEDMRVSGIEVFKVEDGLFTDCWNSAYSLGYWGTDDGLDVAAAPAQAADADRPTRSARDTVAAFFEARNARDAGALRALLADRVIELNMGSARAATRDELAAELADGMDAGAAFAPEILMGDERHICAIWNRSGSSETPTMSGIEVFRITDGRISHRWLTPETERAWGRRGDPAVPADLPPPRLLDSTDEIDHHWMQAVFQHAGVDLPRLALVQTQPVGNGTASETVRASLGYNQDVHDVPANVICKFHAHVPERDALTSAMQPHSREAAVYKFFGKSPPVLTPHLYWANVSADGMRSNMVMEDLGAFCVPGNQVEGCGQQEAASVVDQLARLHRAYWNNPELEALPWTSRAMGHHEAAADLYASGLVNFRRSYASLMTDAEMQVIEGFAPLVRNWALYTPRNIALIHRDPRVDNIMFAQREGGKVDAYLIDWQMIDIGEPQYDLAYFLSGSVSPEDRRACERRLIAQHAAFIAEVDPSYTIEEAEKGYRRQIVSGLYTTLLACNGLETTPHTTLLITALARRNCAAVMEWDGLNCWAAETVA